MTRGFANPQNNCYFNTALQCLFHVPALSNCLNDKPHRGSCAFSRAYCDLLRKYWRAGETSVLDATPLLREFQKHFPRFVDEEQHDVQEAILCVIDILERAEPTLKKLFYGKKTQETIWPGGKNSTEEVFSVHLLTTRPKASLEQMLQDSTAWHTLEGFVDGEGKSHHVATTRTVFSEMPPMLMISFDKKSVVSLIDRLQIGRVKYRLVASALHSGVQFDGHYVSCVWHKGWYLVNDEHTDPLAGGPPSPAGHYFLIYIAEKA